MTDKDRLSDLDIDLLIEQFTNEPEIKKVMDKWRWEQLDKLRFQSKAYNAVKPLLERAEHELKSYLKILSNDCILDSVFNKSVAKALLEDIREVK